MFFLKRNNSSELANWLGSRKGCEVRRVRLAPNDGTWRNNKVLPLCADVCVERPLSSSNVSALTCETLIRPPPREGSGEGGAFWAGGSKSSPSSTFYTVSVWAKNQLHSLFFFHCSCRVYFVFLLYVFYCIDRHSLVWNNMSCLFWRCLALLKNVKADCSCDPLPFSSRLLLPATSICPLPSLFPPLVPWTTFFFLNFSLSLSLHDLSFGYYFFDNNEIPGKGDVLINDTFFGKLTSATVFCKPLINQSNFIFDDICKCFFFVLFFRLGGSSHWTDVQLHGVQIYRLYISKCECVCGRGRDGKRRGGPSGYEAAALVIWLAVEGWGRGWRRSDLPTGCFCG